MAEENGRVCAVCGKPLTGRQERYCSKRCKGKAERNRLRESRPKAIKVCQNCGKEFVADPKNRKYCSEECVQEQRKAQVLRYRVKKRAKKKKPVIICAVCGREFEGWNTGAKYCSDECRIVARRSEVTTKICAYCGKEFTGRSGSKFCSEECRKAEINQERAVEKSKPNGLYCKVCGKPLTGRQRTVCSTHCASRRHAEKAKQTAIKPKKAARGSVSNERICKVCGKPLTGKQRIFCSDKCKGVEYYKPQKAARAINKAARQQKKAEKQSGTKERFCKVCGKPLTGRKMSYCKDCAEKRNAGKTKKTHKEPALRICKNCGKEFVSIKARRYCSDKCRSAGILKGKAAEKSKLNGLYCKVCGKPLTGRQRTVCSTACASKRSKAALKQAKQQNEPQTQICPNCGKEFVVTPGRRYCSDECREAARAQRLDARKKALNGLFCKICGEPLTGKQSMFCSPECERKRGRADKKHIPRICENCGKAFEGSRVQRFCSKECKYAAITQKKAEGKSKPNGLLCKVCGEPLTGIQRIFCSTRCENRYYRKQRAEREKENTKD